MSRIIREAFAEWRECREEYDAHLFAQYERAADACRDAMVNARGRRLSIDPVSLFMGTEARAYAYASEELIEWWETHKRVTFEAFELQWIAAKVAER